MIKRQKMDQENYQELQMLDYQLRQLQQVIENLDNQLVQVSEIKTSLLAFEKINTEEEALMPIANGIFAKGRSSKDKTLLVNVGNNVVLEKTVAETVKMMDEQMVELENYRSELNAQASQLMIKLQSYQHGGSK